ncbi:MAG: phosphotransferase [Patescibacteria group bacterium]|nr:phosphotransferase [Patescibacteria group bacterium]
MNKIRRLLDEEFVFDYLSKKLLPIYSDFEKIKKIKIIQHKDNIWHGAYHVVFEFKISFSGKDKKVRTLPIFCSAHSDEPRKNVYDSLSFLWNNDFDKGYLSIPYPLFFSKYFNATFYRGVSGHNLYYYIRNKEFEVIEDVVVKFAKWLVKLHNIKTKKNFNPINSRVKTVYPGIEHILKRIKKDYPKYGQIYKKIYGIINNNEKVFLNSVKDRWLIHGDAHPENVIKMSLKKIGVIDFTDLCLSDFARDLGSFTQQLDYMMMRKINNQKYADKVKKIFLDNYFINSKEKNTKEVQARIKNYYNWTAMRTITFFLIKSGPEPQRAAPLIGEVMKNIGIVKK